MIIKILGLEGITLEEVLIYLDYVMSNEIDDDDLVEHLANKKLISKFVEEEINGSNGIGGIPIKIITKKCKCCWF